MLDGLKPYPKYKDAREPWLGTIPAHWETRRNGRLFSHRVETGFPDLPVLEVSIRTGVRIRNLDSAARKQVMSDFSKYKRTCRGDIAYNMMRMWQGAVGVSPVDGLVSPAYVVARPHAGTNTWFYDYVFRTPAYMDEVNNFSRGIVSDRNRLYWDEFKQMPSPFPPPAEQAGIVRFLGAVDRKVNRFIRAKRRLIEVLTEQKQAIITHAVTRGLNPAGRLKPSGTGWLGDVPESWRVLPLKRWVVAKITDGPHETPSLQEDGIDFVSAEGMVNGKIVFARRRGYITRELHETYCQKCRPQRDDIFMCKSGNTTGKVALVDTEREFSVWSPLALIRCKRNWAVPKLLFLVLGSKYVQHQVQDRSSYGTQPNLSMGAMERIIVALPVALEEQNAMLHTIESRTEVIDATVERALREIDLIREYRTRLVADVVTGKVDVRAAAAALPDEPDPPHASHPADAADDPAAPPHEGGTGEEAGEDGDEAPLSAAAGEEAEA